MFPNYPIQFQTIRNLSATIVYRYRHQKAKKWLIRGRVVYSDVKEILLYSAMRDKSERVVIFEQKNRVIIDVITRIIPLARGY